MTPTLKQLIELAGDQARRVLIHLGQSLMPTWLLINNKGDLTILGTPWRDDHEKRLARMMMRKYFREHNIVTYSVVIEAWSATKASDWEPGPDYQGASQEPNRREVVMAIATDGKELEVSAWAIQRDWNEQVRALEPIKDLQGGSPLGWMAELLKKP